MKRAVSFALELRETTEHLHEWIAMTAAGRSSWSPTSDNVSGLWTALTDDKLKAWPGWSAYKNGTKHRHRYIHEAGPVTSKQAESFIGAVERLLAHMQDAVAVWGKEWYPELLDSYLTDDGSLARRESGSGEVTFGVSCGDAL